MDDLTAPLTRRQCEIYQFLLDHHDQFEHAPTLSELCAALGLASRGSLHKHITALIEAGLVEPLGRKRRGIRLTEAALQDPGHLPLLGRIAAGRPIEAIARSESVQVPTALRTNGDCFVLEVRGDSMIEDGILDGDWVVIEQRQAAGNGETVVALIDGEEATLKRIEQLPGKVVLHPANGAMNPMEYPPERVQLQGVLVGVMRRC